MEKKEFIERTKQSLMDNLEECVGDISFWFITRFIIEERRPFYIKGYKLLLEGKTDDSIPKHVFHHIVQNNLVKGYKGDVESLVWDMLKSLTRENIKLVMKAVLEGYELTGHGQGHVFYNKQQSKAYRIYPHAQHIEPLSVNVERKVIEEHFLKDSKGNTILSFSYEDGRA